MPVHFISDVHDEIPTILDLIHELHHGAEKEYMFQRLHIVIKIFFVIKLLDFSQISCIENTRGIAARKDTLVRTNVLMIIFGAEDVESVSADFKNFRYWM